MTFQLYHLVVVGGMMFYLGFAIAVIFVHSNTKDDDECPPTHGHW